ncbi:OsmC family protein [Algoriphagus aquatilis]|uniref:OsmC family protein n=1 Tax=Algoriphagus aquatilis TaxID=490186 RepID=A0ABW0BVP1_9BACT
MEKITSTLKKKLYKTEIRSSSGNILISDEPESVGGKNLGFSPTQLLASSLAACTSATLRMYADRKGWDLEEVKLEVSLEVNREDNKTEIHRKIELIGNLDQSQRDRMLAIANACPVHKILSGTIAIKTDLKEN